MVYGVGYDKRWPTHTHPPSSEISNNGIFFGTNFSVGCQKAATHTESSKQFGREFFSLSFEMSHTF
jgi:hypothetical protein